MVVVPRRREVRGLEHLEVALLGGAHDVPDRRDHLLAGGVIGDAGGAHHHRVLDRCAQHAVHLLDGALGDDPAGRPARRHALAGDVGERVHERAVGMQAGEQGVELARASRPAGSRATWASTCLGPVHVVHGAELVDAQLLLPPSQVGDDPEHVAGDPVLDAEVRLRERAAPRRRPARRGRAAPPGPRARGPRAGRRSGGRRTWWRSSAESARQVLPEAGGDLVDGGGLGHDSAPDGLAQAARGRPRRRGDPESRPSVPVASVPRAALYPPNSESWSPVRSMAGSRPSSGSRSASADAARARPTRAGGRP